MTSSYGHNPWSPSTPSGSKVDTIRLLLRITEEPYEMTDEELTYFINNESGSSMTWIAYKVAQSIVGNYANQVTRSMGPLSISLSDKFEHWKAITENMRIAATSMKTATPLFHSSDNGEKIFSIGFQDYDSGQPINPLADDS
jgi:hypothetical protein